MQRKYANLYRDHKIITYKQGIQVKVEHKNAISFCSNDYLGLSQHPEIVEAFCRGAINYGVSSGSSFIVSGKMPIHYQVEEKFSDFVGQDKALLFSTGYMSNIGILSGLMDRNDEIFQDKQVHASLIDGGILSRAKLTRYRHGDLDHLEEKLKHSSAKCRCIVTDSVFSMSGHITPLPDLVQLAEKFNAVVMLDDGHGIGILGKGRGAVQHFHLANQIALTTYPLGKALGCYGGIVAGEKLYIDALSQFAKTYIYTAALPAANAFALNKSLDILQQEQWRQIQLFNLVNIFRDGCAERGLNVMPSSMPIQSILVGDAKLSLQLSNFLLEQGFWCPAIRPPTVPEGTARLRFTLTALHSKQQIEDCLDVLKKGLSLYIEKVPDVAAI